MLAHSIYKESYQEDWFKTSGNLPKAREWASKLRILGSNTRNMKKSNRNLWGLALPIKRWLVSLKFVLDMTSESTRETFALGGKHIVLLFK